MTGDEVDSGPGDDVEVASPIIGTIVSIVVGVGDAVAAGDGVVVIESMKMEHVVTAEASGVVTAVLAAPGDVVAVGTRLVALAPAHVPETARPDDDATTAGSIRDDLQMVIDRHALALDESRPDAVARRLARGHSTARSNIARLVDPGTFQEYWPLVVAHQHSRRSIDELRRDTSGDGVVAGTGMINGSTFPRDRARAVVIHYDYTVLAGTQGIRGHRKVDRMLDVASSLKVPVVLFAEGGGGRPGDDSLGPAITLDVPTFTAFARLSGAVPLVAVAHGHTFAGNTALAACADVIIATRGANIAMGGPAMIEGGGLGTYRPEEIAPTESQVRNGVIDILVADESAAVDAVKSYLSYFQGPVAAGEAHDPVELRGVVPENRLRLYDMRRVIELLADVGSVLELREGFGRGVITALARVGGRPIGVIANNPAHLAGAIDSDGADKAARFMQLLDAFDVPILSLVDCPGIMVGPDAESTALVRHAARMFAVGANLSTPFMSVNVRKAYGLGAQMMNGGHVGAGVFSVAWPTAEFAGMNLDGAVRLGFRREIEAIEDLEERERWVRERTARALEAARAVNSAAGGGVDDVIDPAQTRTWISRALDMIVPGAPRAGKKRPFVDPW